MARPKILLVEDDDDLLTSYANVATTLADCEPVLAKNYKELIEQKPEVLECQMALLDLKLHEIEFSGIDAFNWLVNEGFKGQIYFATGHGKNHPLVSQACELKNAQVVSKPMTIDQLIRIFMRQEP